jgi:hypothetical protein
MLLNLVKEFSVNSFASTVILMFVSSYMYYKRYIQLPTLTNLQLLM